jgi:hypothetical protein
MPFVTLSPGRQPDRREGVMLIVSPIDDERHLLFFGLYSETEMQDAAAAGSQPADRPQNLHDYAPLPGGRDQRWGQDRALMAAGHFTGFGNNLIEEDMVVQASMGPIVDRSREYLSATDVAVVKARRLLLDALVAYQDGRIPPGSALSPAPVVLPDPVVTVVSAEPAVEAAGAR